MKRWVIRIGGGLLVLVVIAVGAIYALSERALGRSYTFDAAAQPAMPDSATLARGRHLATAIGKCVACHGDDLGGAVFMDNPAMGRFVAPNLTPAAEVRRTPADIERALRHGIGADGRPLAFMPSDAYAHFTRDDMAALLAYLATLPPVTRALPGRSVGPVSRVIVATSPFLAVDRIDHDLPVVDSITPAADERYGRYLASVGGCASCHNANMSGGKEDGPPGTPPAANLTPGGRDWTLEDFTRALRDGVKPGGVAIDSFMPVRLTRLMTDQEIEAVWRYIRSLPPKEFGEP